MASTETARYWCSVDAAKARMQARREHAENERMQAVRQIAAVYWHRAAEPLRSDLPDRDLCQLAERRAELMAQRIAALAEPMDLQTFGGWLQQQVQALGADKLPELQRDGRSLADQIAGMVARVQCPLWWRRKLRRAVVRLRETEAMHAGEVGQRRAWYVTDDTMRRRIEQDRRNASILESTEIESEDGEIITLAEAAAASVANKAIRRGELMTRIRGCEELADALGMVGIFTTNTAPSRYHPTSKGERNPKHDGSTPRDAQRWLCRTWAKTRAALQRAKLRVFGFRVAEPHADGCPHWHMLLWMAPEHVEQVQAIMRRYWLADDGAEPGAAEHRFKAKRLDKGGAVSYVAKYIAKNVDDAGAVAVEGHYDEDARLVADAQGDLFRSAAKRVEAWASAWGIRQFQAIGQPPVTVWRELRRIKPEGLSGASERIVRAWEAAHRHGERRADWANYVIAQGGVMRGRAYLIHVAKRLQEREGRYERREVARPVGVVDKLRPGEWVLSDRREWRPRGCWHRDQQAPARPARAAWTRFNNCTRIAGQAIGRRAPLRTWTEQLSYEDAPDDRRGAMLRAWRDRFRGKPHDDYREGAPA